MIGPDDPYFGVQRIGRERFADVLRQFAAPAVLAERDPREYWDVCQSWDVDALFILAMFNHESSGGRAGVAVTTHSWGNTRMPTFGGVTVIRMVPGRSGEFPVFRDWRDGLISTVARLASPDWYYRRESRTIGQVFNDPLHRDPPIEWAPAGDLNNPAGYLRAMLDFMNRHEEQERPMALTIREATNWQGPNRPGLSMIPRWVTIHETSNTNVGANAEMHRKFVQSGGGRDGVSFHWVVDDTEAIHLVPDNEVAWHAGDGRDGTGNRQSVAIETCVHADGDWAATRRNLTILAATLMVRHGIPLANVVQHNRWSSKNCPLVMRRDGLWAGQVAAIDVAFRALTAPPPVPAGDHWLVRAWRELFAA
jgi:N-acetylmuramoyl-L-alanine amidase